MLLSLACPSINTFGSFIDNRKRTSKVGHQTATRKLLPEIPHLPWPFRDLRSSAQNKTCRGLTADKINSDTLVPYHKSCLPQGSTNAAARAAARNTHALASKQPIRTNNQQQRWS